MDLKLKDVAKLLQVSEKTVYRWINDNKIPYYRINHQYRFKTDELNQWSMQNNVDFAAPLPIEGSDEQPVSVLDHLDRGGIYYNVSGNDVESVLTNSVKLLNLPAGVEQNVVLSHLIEREKMMSTGIGQGIAFPHPRNPVVPSYESESVSIIFLHKPVDYKSLDSIPVHTLFVILSAEVTRHLKLLSQLTFLCKQEAFVDMLKKQDLRENIIGYIEKNLVS